MSVIELERTFLAKHLPEGLASSPSKQITDIYMPEDTAHPVLRLRQNGDSYELTKKTPVEGGDSSRQTEETIVLSAEEFRALSACPGRRVSKLRYRLETPVGLAEVDVFDEALAGLVLVDFEFESVEQKAQFVAPDFCGAEVTQDKFTAGGMLAGKAYADIEAELERRGYVAVADPAGAQDRVLGDLH